MINRWDRRAFVLGAGALAISPSVAPFADGQTILIGGAEFFLTDIAAPSTSPLSGAAEPMADFAAAVLREALSRGALAGAPATLDRWERRAGAVLWRINGRETTLQEVLLAQGAARVAPQSDDFDFIERCYRAESAARAAALGLWSHKAYRIRDAGVAQAARGYQVYAGTIRTTAERGARVFFNFGDDFRTDFTASAARSSFRRWRGKPDAASFVGAKVEIRGPVERINGPSIELKHELQLRRL